MATFAFETISNQAALLYDAVLDTLTFASDTAGQVVATLGPARINLISAVSGRSVDFDFGLAGETDFVFPDGSRLFIGRDQADAFAGGAEPDRLYGGVGVDTLSGGGGPDTLAGGPGGDLLSGGPGADLFVFAAGDGGTGAGLLDTIPDWAAEDRMAVPNGAATAANYLEGTAPSFASALSVANTQIFGGSYDIVVLQVGPDVIVFVDSNADDGSAEAAIVLSGRTLADIDAATFIVLPTPTLTGRNVAGEGDADLIVGTFGPDRLAGGGGSDTLNGGPGADTLAGGEGSNLLHGDEGSDSVQGGSGFDDINGNMGEDTAAGGAGDDWVVGGKDNDVLFGDDGGDVVLGNLGADTCDGGAGADIVRGGQADDVLFGGEGADFLSGDRGADTVTGGSGADIFHGFADAGLDRILDFSAAQGDRVMLDPGTTFTLRQDGANLIVDMGGENRMVLVDVTLSSLQPGWIFGA